jgi:hypothetical protein
MVENCSRTGVEKLQNDVAFLHLQLVQLSIASNPYGEFMFLSLVFHLLVGRWC